MTGLIIGGWLVFPFQSAFAANECGAGSAGATVTCNGDGSPASDNSPYANGITYTTPLNLIVDGTNTPLVSGGRIGVTSNAGAQSTTVIGNVDIIRNDPANSSPSIGDIGVHARDLAITAGAGVDIVTTNSILNRTLYGIAGAGSNSAMSINSAANIDISNNNAGTGSTRGIYLYDGAGGSNSTLSIHATGGNINLYAMNGSSVSGIQATSESAGTASTVSIDSAANINIITDGTQTSQVRGIYSRNYGAGDAYVKSSGTVNIDAGQNTFTLGIFASSNGNVTADVLGSVSVSALSHAYALSVTAGGATGLSTANVFADMTAVSTGAGNYAAGIYSGPATSFYDFTVGDNVTITAQSESNAVGISSAATQGGIINIGQGAVLNATADNNAATGIRALGSISNIINIGAGAEISTNGETKSSGISVDAGTYDITMADDSKIEAISNQEALALDFSLSSGGSATFAANTSIYANGTNVSYALHGSALGIDDITSAADITGEVFTDGGNDIVRLNGGIINGGIDMGSDDDALYLTNLTATQIENLSHIYGGTGTDAVTFSNIDWRGSTMASDDLSNGINLGDGWETINLVNSNWELTGNMVMGGSAINIDSSSTLFAGNGINSVIESALPNDPVIVTNAGVIDLTNGNSGTTDTLTIRGNYIGANGQILMNVAANGMTASSDTITIDGSNGGGSASGTTFITIVNTDMLQAPTTGNGILLIETINGATMAADAFELTNPRISAGAYDYILDFSNASQNFYLTSLLAPRDEVMIYNSLQDASHRFGLAMLGNYNTRALSQNKKSRVWTRAFAQNGKIGNSGNVAAHGPGYDYNAAGGQVGMDLHSTPEQEKNRDIFGVYAGTGYLKTDITNDAGTGKITGYSAGAYWTHTGNSEKWYVDSVLQGTIYNDISTRSSSGESLTTKGRGLLASVEGGINQKISDSVSLTYQAQLIAQTLDIKDNSDSFGRIDFGPANAVYARVGPKLEKTIETDQGYKIRTWIQPNLWHNFSSTSDTTVSNLAGTNTTSFQNDLGASSAQLSFGVSTQMSRKLSFYAEGSYDVSLNRPGNSISGQVGLKFRW